MRVDTFRYNLLRSDAIQSRFVNFRFTISHGLISRSDTITYVPIGLLRSSLRLGLDLTRSSRSGSPNWDDLIRADTFRYVHHEPIRSVTIAYDCVLDVFHDHDRGWSRFGLRLEPYGYIYAAGLTMKFIVSWVFTACTDPQPLMMSGLADDDNVAFAVLLYSYIIVREEEDEQQTDQRQPQPQRARRAAARQFWVRSWLREERRNLWARELVADRERSCKNLTTRIYSH